MSSLNNVYSFRKRLLWLRSEKGRAIMRVRSKLLEAARNWFKHHRYLEVQRPTVIPWNNSFCDTERKTHLTQEVQPYTLAMLSSFEKIYTIAPYFRAEKKRTTRHLKEYWCIEAERSQCDLEEIMKVQEKLLTHICRFLIKNVSEELTKVGRDIKKLSLVRHPFPKITYDNAIKMLQDDEMNIHWGQELTFEQEKQLTQHFDKPFFMTHYPMEISRLFYKAHPQRGELTLSADLMAPGHGEIAGATEMMDRKELQKKMKEEKMRPEDYQPYIDLERYSAYSPCSGFALGVERAVKWICKLKDIRDATAFSK